MSNTTHCFFLNCALSGLILLLLNPAAMATARLPQSDLAEIENNKSVLTAYTCEDLIEKANDKSFTLRSLAALRAASRCADFTYDISQLTESERRLYAGEIKSLEPISVDPDSLLSMDELNKKIRGEKKAAEKYALYKSLRLRQRQAGNRSEMIKTADATAKWALKHLRQNRKSEEAYKILYESAQQAAKDHWTADDSKAALKILDQAIAAIGKNRSVAELVYLKGRIHEESKKTELAEKFYNQTLQDIAKHQPTGLSFNTDRVLWLKAWLLYKDAKYTEAEAAFADLANATQDLSERSRALFYQARALKQLKQNVQARILLEAVAENDFFGYYGLVAHREIGKKFPALKSLKPSAEAKHDLRLGFLGSEHHDLFRALLKYREFNLAERAVSILAKNNSEELDMGLYLAREYNIYLPLFRAFSRLENSEKINVFLRYPELIFPQPYESDVRKMAEKTKLSSSLIYSIMKQESAFNSKALSGANAMGLMQVIPPLARQLSKKFEVPFSQNSDLYNPSINIQLGSYELMEQVQKQNGQLTYVAAAYNAGPNALAGWLKTRMRDDVLEFIEDIPYEETRTYVKLIARNALFYRRVSDRDSEHDFPADFLN